jgi:hypothetical protein
MDKVLQEIFAAMSRANLLVVTMLVKRRFRASWAQEAAECLRDAAKRLDELSNHKAGA